MVQHRVHVKGFSICCCVNKVLVGECDHLEKLARALTLNLVPQQVLCGVWLLVSYLRP